MAQARKRKQRPKKSRPKDAAAQHGDASDDAALDVASRRRRARWRSLLVPGAGLWELGLVGPGWVCYGVAIATLACCGAIGPVCLYGHLLGRRRFAGRLPGGRNGRVRGDWSCRAA